MPSITVPALRDAFINIVVSSPHPEAAPAHIIPGAAEFVEIASKIEAALEEYKHLGEHDTWVASAKQLATYLTANGAANFYAVRSLTPAGSLTEVDDALLFDIHRIRFALVFAILPGALQADEREAHAYARHWQRAVKDLLVTGYGLANVFIPGDQDRRPGDRTEIEVMLELGAAHGRLRYEQSP